jgi:RND family efflux transporter MFP subunit
MLSKQDRTKTRILLAGLLALALLASWGYSRALGKRTDTTTHSVATVAAVRAVRQPISRRVTLEAEFEPYQEVDIRAKVAGYVRNISVDIGARVRQGQLLASLEVPELKSDRDQAAATVQRREAEVKRAAGQLSVAQAAYQVAHLTYVRLASVNKAHPGLVAEQDVDDALGRDQQAEAQVSASRAALGAARAALTEALGNQSRVQAMLDYSRITAPFAGVITKRYVNTGTMVPAGTSSSTQATPVVSIAQTDPLRLVIYVPASLVPHLRAGTVVAVRFSTTAKLLELPIARMADAVDVASRTMRVEVDVPNPNSELAPGEYAQAELPVERLDDALVVPLVAMLRNGSQASLWVINPAHRLELRPVKLGIESAGLAQVVSGVSENDLVAVGPSSAFQAGDEVNPKPVELPDVEGGQ